MLWDILAQLRDPRGVIDISRCVPGNSHNLVVKVECKNSKFPAKIVSQIFQKLLIVVKSFEYILIQKIGSHDDKT